MEAGDGDSTKFLEWQQNLKEKDAAEKLAEIERKHLVGQMVWYNSIIMTLLFIRLVKSAMRKLYLPSNNLFKTK